MKAEPESSETVARISNPPDPGLCGLTLGVDSPNGNDMHSSPSSQTQLVVSLRQFSENSPTADHVELTPRVSSEILAEVNCIEEYVARYLVKFQKYPEVYNLKLKRIVLKILSIGVGVGVGYSWLAPARASCESPVWGDITGYSMLFSYGIASAWTCFELVDYFFASFPEAYRLKSAALKTSYGFWEHLVCHFLGLLSAIPVTYVTYTYNKQIPITLLDGIVAYAYNTFGLYQLNRGLLVPLYLSYKNTHNQLLADRSRYIIEVSEHVPEYFSEQVVSADKSYEEQRQVVADDTESLHAFFLQNFSNNLDFIRNYEASIVLPGKWHNGIPKKAFQYLTTGIVAITNAIVLGVLTNNALASIFDIDNGFERFLAYTVIALVMSATVGLLIYTQEVVLSNIFDQLYFACTQKNLASSHIAMFVYMSLFMVSVASGHTAYYVSKSQLEGTVLTNYAIFFAAMMWAGETFFEGVGLISIAKQFSIYCVASLINFKHLLPSCITLFNSSIHLANRLLAQGEYQAYLKNYGLMLSTCADETYNAYAEKHHLKRIEDSASRNRFFPPPVVRVLDVDAQEPHDLRNT